MDTIKTWVATFTVGTDPEIHYTVVESETRHGARQQICPPDFVSPGPFRTLQTLEVQCPQSR